MNATLDKAPMQWADLQDIHDVEPLNDADFECLVEVRDVLKKHGKRDRFGVMLVHKHFDLASDEVLVEYTDPEARVLTIKPVKKEQAGRVVETNWVLGEGDPRAMLGCAQYCGLSSQGNHIHLHKPT